MNIFEIVQFFYNKYYHEGEYYNGFYTQPSVNISFDRYYEILKLELNFPAIRKNFVVELRYVFFLECKFTYKGFDKNLNSFFIETSYQVISHVDTLQFFWDDFWQM